MSVEVCEVILGEAAYNKMTQISLSNNTIRSRVNDIADDIQNQVVKKVPESPFFSI